MAGRDAAFAAHLNATSVRAIRSTFCRRVWMSQVGGIHAVAPRIEIRFIGRICPGHATGARAR